MTDTPGSANSNATPAEEPGSIRDRASARYAEARDRVGAAYLSGRERAEDAYRSARDQASETLETGRARASQAVATTRQEAQAAARRVREEAGDNPLAALIGGLAVGALAGALLPRTQREDALLGSVGDKIRTTAGNAAQAARKAGKEELDALGINAETARAQVGKIVDTVVKGKAKG